MTRFAVIAQLYWPVWLLFLHYGYNWIGILAGVIVVIGLEMLAWRMTFGTYRFWT